MEIVYRKYINEPELVILFAKVQLNHNKLIVIIMIVIVIIIII